MSVPAGWYDDGSGRQRWWDGEQWTEHFAPEAGATVDADADSSGSFDADGTPADATEFAAGEEPLANRGADAWSSEIAADADASAPTEQPTAEHVDAPAAYTPPENIPPYASASYAPPADPSAGAAYDQPTAAYPGYPGQAPSYAAGAYAAPGAVAPKKTPVLGFIGLGLAVVGAILVFIPSVVTFITGSAVLFAALVVSIIALFLKNTKKWPSITGLIVSILAGIIGAIVFSVFVFFTAVVNNSVDSFPTATSAPVWPSDEPSDEPLDESTDEPSDLAPEGRPTAEEVAVGLDEIVAMTGEEDTFTDEQLACYGQYFVDSDIPDDTLWVIASGTEIFSNADAAMEFSQKLSEGMSTCLFP